MTTGTLTLGRPAHLRSIVAGFTAIGLAVGLTVGVLVTREVLEERAVPTVRAHSPTAIWENSAAAVREQGAVLPQLRSAFENSTAAVREQGATLPWYVVAAQAGFTGRLGGTTSSVGSAFENSTAAVREQGAVLPQVGSAFENSTAAVREQGASLAAIAWVRAAAYYAKQGLRSGLSSSMLENSMAAIREQGATLPWYAIAARAGFTGRLGGATEDVTIVRRHGHLTPKSSVFDEPSGGSVISVNGQPCRQCL